MIYYQTEIMAMMERVLLFLIHREPSVAESTAVREVRKTLRSLRKKAVRVIRTARSSRKDVIEWIAFGGQFGWYRGSLPFVPWGTEGFFVFFINSVNNNFEYTLKGG